MGEVGVSFSPTTVLARSLSSGEKFKKELRHQGKIIDTSQLSINLTQLITHIGLRLGLHVMSLAQGGGGGALGYFLGGYVPPGTPNLHPVLEFALKLIPRSRNGPIFYTPF